MQFSLYLLPSFLPSSENPFHRRSSSDPENPDKAMPIEGPIARAPPMTLKDYIEKMDRQQLAVGLRIT
jgi:hypothetical protein